MPDPVPSTAPRLLVLLRHSQAQQGPDARGEDRGRPLTARGVADAADVGRWLAEAGVVPDLVLLSPALRTRQTCDAVVGELPLTPTTREVEGLYGAEPRDVVEHLLGVPEDAEVVLVVGHNPTMQDLIWDLQSAPSSPWPQNLPTSGVVVLDLPGPWSDLEEGSATLVAHHIGHAQLSED